MILHTSISREERIDYASTTAGNRTHCLPASIITRLLETPTTAVD